VIVALAVVAQLAIVAHGPDSASVCEAFEVSVAVSAKGSAVPRVTPPSFYPFDILRSSPVPHVSFDNRPDGSVTAEYRYVLTTDHPGTYTLAPFEARLGNAVIRSRPVQVAVHTAGHAQVPAVVARARIDTSLAVDFRALALPETVYVGQQANYEVAVFLNAAVRDRLRRNPTFFPPDMQSMLAYDLPARANPPRREGGSHCFDALVYQRALFPLMPGRFAIPPAQLVYSLPLSASFFSREETHELETDSTIIIAVEPPMAGRPADFGGAIGNVRLATRLDTSASRVGDPMVLTVRVMGTGNVKLFPRPAVGVPWATLVKGDERVRVDTTARHIAGSKEFDWLLTPKVAGELDVPPIRYGYFNPDTRRYEVASTGSTHVRVGPGSLASADTARTETLLPLRPRYRGALRAPVHESPAFWALLALAPLPAVTLRRRSGKRTPTPRANEPSRRLAATIRTAISSRDASAVRRAYTAALSERLSLQAENFTRAGGLARVLRRRGVSTGIAAQAERFLRELDEAAFASGGALPADAAERAERLFRAVDDESLPRAQIMTRAIGIVFIAAIGATVAHATTKHDDPRRTFDAGVEAYQRHEFVAARESFVESVEADPRAPDAWANLGTAAWAVADTARSVAAWQRALRLEPLAPDVRDRVELVHSLPVTASGFVPPLPVESVFVAAAFLWCATWGWAALRTRRGGHVRRTRLASWAVVAGIVALCGVALSERAAGRHLDVLRYTASLSTDPEIGGERGPTAIVGEVVREIGRQGAWTRVRLDDGRDGWVETAALISLDSRDASQIAN
jgi:BatD DUF11 like domain